jgi:hypothetical protein
MEPGSQSGALCAVAEAKRHCLRPRRADHGLSTLQQPELTITFTKGPTPRSTCSWNFQNAECEAMRVSEAVQLCTCDIPNSIVAHAQQATVRNPQGVWCCRTLEPVLALHPLRRPEPAMGRSVDASSSFQVTIHLHHGRGLGCCQALTLKVAARGWVAGLCCPRCCPSAHEC